MLDKAIGTQKWRTFFGHIYNWYINELIGCFATSSDVLIRQFYPNKKFQGMEHEVCDGLILWENTAALCEYKGTRLTTRARAGIVISESIDAIEKMIGSKDSGVGQLAKNIRLALAGNLVASGNELIDLRRYRRILPVLICQEEVAVNHAVRHYLQELFTKFLTQEPAIDVSQLGPLLLFSTRDIELFEQLVQIDGAENLICKYADFVHENPRDPMGIFHSYGHHKYAGQPQPQGYVNTKLMSGSTGN